MIRSKIRTLSPQCGLTPLSVAGVVGCFVAGCIGVGCSAGGSGADTPGGSEQPAPGSTGLVGTSGSGAVFGDPSQNLGTGVTTQGCNMLQIAFESTTPTALVVVDRSSSQWDGNPSNWEPVKQGLINVIEQVQNDINIGLVTYTGQAGGTCPELIPALNTVTFTKGNAAVIRSALEAVQQPSFKGETPTALAIEAAIPVLLAAPSTGPKFILLVTDGDPDFCNDGDQVCPMDAVVGAVQKAKAQGIGTTVFGLQRAGVALSGQHLQDVANAGAGQPVGAPIQRLEDFVGRCQGKPALGSYAPFGMGGNAHAFLANATNQSALGEALDQIVAGIRSCTFELAGAVKVDLNRASLATISIDNATPLGFQDPNGWRMVTETQVEIMGSACTLLKSPQTNGVAFDFPCDIISPR